MMGLDGVVQGVNTVLAWFGGGIVLLLVMSVWVMQRRIKGLSAQVFSLRDTSSEDRVRAVERVIMDGYVLIGVMMWVRGLLCYTMLLLASRGVLMFFMNGGSRLWGAGLIVLSVAGWFWVRSRLKDQHCQYFFCTDILLHERGVPAQFFHGYEGLQRVEHFLAIGYLLTALPLTVACLLVFK